MDQVVDVDVQVLYDVATMEVTVMVAKPVAVIVVVPAELVTVEVVDTVTVGADEAVALFEVAEEKMIRILVDKSPIRE